MKGLKACGTALVAEALALLCEFSHNIVICGYQFIAGGA